MEERKDKHERGGGIEESLPHAQRRKNFDLIGVYENQPTEGKQHCNPTKLNKADCGLAIDEFALIEAYKQLSIRFDCQGEIIHKLRLKNASLRKAESDLQR